MSKELKVAITIYTETPPGPYGVYERPEPHSGKFSNGKLLAMFNDEKDAKTFAVSQKLVEALNDCIESLKRLPDVDGAYRVTCIQQAQALLDELKEV
jgi:hypothetical protein